MRVANFSRIGSEMYRAPVSDPKPKTSGREIRRADNVEGRFENSLEIQHQESCSAPNKKSGPLSGERVTSATAPERSASPLRKGLERSMEKEAEVQKHLEKVMRRGVSNMQELVEIQMSVYRYTQHVELLSKSVDRANQSLKQTLQTRL